MASVRSSPPSAGWPPKRLESRSWPGGEASHRKGDGLDPRLRFELGQGEAIDEGDEDQSHYEEIVVRRSEFVSVRLTPEAYAMASPSHCLRRS
jgi:hypothetical protein